MLVNIRGLPADDPYVQNEMREIRQQVEERSTMRLSKKQQFRKLLAPGTRNRVGVGAFLMFLQSFTGVNIMTYFSPRIFETLGIVGTRYLSLCRIDADNSSVATNCSAPASTVLLRCSV